MQPKYSLVFCVILLVSLKVKSQTPRDSTPANCNWNLVNNIFDSISVAGPYYYGKTNANPPYKQATYAGETECKLTSACKTNDTSDLKMMAYFPAKHAYNIMPLPALVFAHSGGFSDCSSYNIKDVDKLCRYFALRGFVTFNIEYRRGRIKDSATKYTSVQQMIAMYKGCQDIRGAIRSIIKFQRNHVALNLPFQIDTNKIFVGGASAGAVMSLNVGYYRNQQMIDTAFPTMAGYSKMKEVLGPINANFYYGDTTINLKGKIKGILSLWGGVPLPLTYEKKQSEFFASIESVDNPPMIGFHGAGDVVFPISGVAKQRVYFSPPEDSNRVKSYNTETYCVSNKIVLDNNGENADITSISGLNMYNILKKLGKLTEFYEDCDMTHGLANDCDTCPFKNNFGTTSTNEGMTWVYIVQRTATFFQAVLNNATPADFKNSTTLFVDCENKRVRCKYADSDNNCSNTDTCVATSNLNLGTFKHAYQKTQQSNHAETPDKKIILYPNPVKDIITLSGIPVSSNARLIIIDAAGKILTSEKILSTTIKKNVFSLIPGIYFAKIITGQKAKIISFVKE